MGATLSADPNDQEKLVTPVDAFTETTGHQFAPRIADASYFSVNNVTPMDTRNVDASIAVGSDQWRHGSGRTMFGKGQFSYGVEIGAHRCPAGHILPFLRTRIASIRCVQREPSMCYLCMVKWKWLFRTFGGSLSGVCQNPSKYVERRETIREVHPAPCRHRGLRPFARAERSKKPGDSNPPAGTLTGWGRA